MISLKWAIGRCDARTARFATGDARRRLWVVPFCVALTVTLQSIGDWSAAYGQTVQLPSSQRFSVNTSVLVPDRGSAYLGSSRYYASGRTSRGMPGGGRLLRNGGIGTSLGGSSSSVHVTIIDHNELDRAVLSAARKGATTISRDTKTSRIVQKLTLAIADARSSNPGNLESVASIRRRVSRQKSRSKVVSISAAEFGNRVAGSGGTK